MLSSIWAHRNPRVKQGILQTVTKAITSMPVALSLPASWLQLVLQPAARLLDDPNRYRRHPFAKYLELVHTWLVTTLSCPLHKAGVDAHRWTVLTQKVVLMMCMMIKYQCSYAACMSMSLPDH